MHPNGFFSKFVTFIKFRPANKCKSLKSGSLIQQCNPEEIKDTMDVYPKTAEESRSSGVKDMRRGQIDTGEPPEDD